MKSSNDKGLFEHFLQCHYYVGHCRKDQAVQAVRPGASTLGTCAYSKARGLKLALCSVFMKTLTLKMGLAASQTDLDPPQALAYPLWCGVISRVLYAEATSSHLISYSTELKQQTFEIRNPLLVRLYGSKWVCTCIAQHDLTCEVSYLILTRAQGC